MLSTGTQSDLLAAGQLLKQYNGALQSQLSRHQHAAHILQALLTEQVTTKIPDKGCTSQPCS